MGWMAEIDYGSVEFDLEPGDRVLLYTDAVIEALSPTGELFGEERFHQLIRAGQTLTATELADSILEHLQNWSNHNGSFEDDLTLIIIDVLDE
ncbi:MAG: serine/threonine-protein phosphatase, partial [Anaerolineae bacterium]|nr:serine/threonine-protein phosphatase [Anaerolineae bacterium]